MGTSRCRQYLSCFCPGAWVVGARLDCLTEVVLVDTHSLCYGHGYGGVSGILLEKITLSGKSLRVYYYVCFHNDSYRVTS